MSEIQQVLNNHLSILLDYRRRFFLLDSNAEERSKEWIKEFNKRCRLLEHVLAMGQEMLCYEDERFKSSFFYQTWHNLLEETRERLWVFASHLPNKEVS